MTAPIAKRADQLVVGDRITSGYLPAYARSGDGEVLYVRSYPYRGADWVFVAFKLDDGDHGSTTYLPFGKLKVLPAADPTGQSYSRADGDEPQPVAGRTPPHFGAVVDEGGHAAVAVAGGLIEIDTPEGFVPAGGES